MYYWLVCFGFLFFYSFFSLIVFIFCINKINFTLFIVQLQIESFFSCEYFSFASYFDTTHLVYLILPYKSDLYLFFSPLLLCFFLLNFILLSDFVLCIDFCWNLKHAIFKFGLILKEKFAHIFLNHIHAHFFIIYILFISTGV